MQRRQLVPVNQVRQNRMQHYQRHDPFRQVQQMMMGIGGLNNDPFLSALMMSIGDPFQDIFKFSDLHKNVHSRGVEGSYVMQSFVSSSKMGPNGQVITQNYFQNNLGEHRSGNTISQKQQAYKNSSGINRIAQQRMLNDRGRKIVRQKIGNNIEETNHYYNIDEQEAARFDADWRQTDRSMKFLQNHQRYLQPLQQPRMMQIGYNGPQQYQASLPYSSPPPQFNQIQSGPIRQRIEPQRVYQVHPPPTPPQIQPQTYQQPRIQHQPQHFIQQGTHPQALQGTQPLKITYGSPLQNNPLQNGSMYRGI